MDRSERLYRIDQLLNERGVVTREAFLEELEESPATFKRDLEYMRDRYNAPAKLRFSAERARWVGSEVWHPEQRGIFDPSGRYTLELPYRDDRELVLEIMKHGGGVEVIGPPDLRKKIRDAHRKAAEINRC